MRISSSLPKFNKQLRYDKDNRLVLLTSSLGLLLLLVITFTLPFNNGLFSKLFTKPFSHAASLSANITIDESNMVKDYLTGSPKVYQSAPPLFQDYQPDATDNSKEFAPDIIRNDVWPAVILPQASASSQLAYNTAHPGDAPCGDPRSDCGEGGNNGGAPEYDWTMLDGYLARLNNPNTAPSKFIFLIHTVPTFLQTPGSGSDSYPTNLTQYANITGDLWHHLYLKAPQFVNKTYFEIWNENAGGLTTQQYEDLYAAVASNIHRTASTFGQTVMTGGPASAWYDANYFQILLSSTEDNPYIDFVTFHLYPIEFLNTSSCTDPTCTWPILASNTPGIVDSQILGAQQSVSQFDTALQKNGGTHPNNIPILLDEYNVTPGTSQTPGVSGAYANDWLVRIPQYETPFLGLYLSRAFNDGLDGLAFYNYAGPGCCVPLGTYLLDYSFEIAPWAWVQYLYDRSVGLHYQTFNVINSSSSDTTQSPVAFKFTDGTLGAVITNTDENASRDYTVTINNLTTLSGNVTIHNYLVTGTTNGVSKQPDIQGTITNNTLTFTVTVPPASVNGFTIAEGPGTTVHLPNYTFHPFFDDFSSYGPAGTNFAPLSITQGQTNFDPEANWVTLGWNNWSSTAGKTATIATPTSDGISFADSAAGTSTNAAKVYGSDQSYIRTGSYHADWAIPPKQKVAITFQTDWASGTGGQNGWTGGWVFLSLDNGNPQGQGWGNVLGTPNWALGLEELKGSFSLITTNAGNVTTLSSATLPSNLLPQSKVLSSWRILIDASTIEVDRFDKASNTWVTFMGPVNHNLPQTPTGMESGFVWLGLNTNDSTFNQAYYANFSVTSFGSSTTPSPSPSLTPTPTPSASPSPTPTPTSSPSSGWVNITPSGLNLSGTYGVSDIELDPTNPSTLYLTADQRGLWKSIDGGTSWNQIGNLATPICWTNPCTTALDSPLKVKVDPSNPNHIYVVQGVRGATLGFWVSNDGGATFSQPAGFNTQVIQPLTNDVYDIAVDPANSQHILLTFHSNWAFGNNPTYGSNAGVVESFDGGNSWTIHNPVMGWGAGHDIFFLNNSSTWLLATQYDGFWKTTDSGSTWTQVSSTQEMMHGGDQMYCQKRTSQGYCDPAGFILLGANHNLIRSTDGGNSWIAINPMAALNITPPDGYYTIGSDGSNLYVQEANTGSNTIQPTNTPYFISSVNDGTTWTSTNRSTCLNGVCDGPYTMAFDSKSQILYSSNWDAGVWKLTTNSQPSPTPTPSQSSCPSKIGDFNNDGSVNLTDLSIFASSYGTSSPNIPNPCTDLNSDGSVNLTDLSLFAAVYGT